MKPSSRIKEIAQAMHDKECPLGNGEDVFDKDIQRAILQYLDEVRIDELSRPIVIDRPIFSNEKLTAAIDESMEEQRKTYAFYTVGDGESFETNKKWQEGFDVGYKQGWSDARAETDQALHEHAKEFKKAKKKK